MALKRHSYLHRDSNGSILLFAMLLLAGGLVGALTVAVLVVGELRQSQTIDSGVTGYFIAESGLENRLFELRQNDLCNQGTGTCDSSATNVLVPAGCTGGVSAGCMTVSQLGITPSTVVTVPLLQQNQTFQLDMNPNSDALDGLVVQWARKSTAVEPLLEVTYEVGLKSNPASGLQQLKDQSGLPFNCGAGTGVTQCNSLSPLSFQTILQVAALNSSWPNWQDWGVYQVRFKAIGGDITSLIVTPSTAGGKFTDYLAIRSRGEVSGTGQTLQTSVPSQLPAYGFSDYVLFSEQQIQK